jgi:hypothetical protein
VCMSPRYHDAAAAAGVPTQLRASGPGGPTRRVGGGITGMAPPDRRSRGCGRERRGRIRVKFLLELHPPRAAELGVTVTAVTVTASHGETHWHLKLRRTRDWHSLPVAVPGSGHGHGDRRRARHGQYGAGGPQGPAGSGVTHWQ